ncbi:hypothetical protein G7Y79_00013g034620 [Physcia stellaris]|nr:hypothetical protein G7Y79_00013g034620 [Physcia stellaris]
MDVHPARTNLRPPKSRRAATTTTTPIAARPHRLPARRQHKDPNHPNLHLRLRAAGLRLLLPLRTHPRPLPHSPRHHLPPPRHPPPAPPPLRPPRSPHLPHHLPAHLSAALRILAPKAPSFPAPTRRQNPGYYELATQAGLQKLMLLGARVEGRVFDGEGVRWVGGIEGGIGG